MLPVNSGGHTAYQTFVLENLRKYYPDPTVFAKSTWDIIERFWNLDLSYTDELLRKANTLSLVQNQGLLPVCNVLIFFPLILKSIPLPIGLLN
ncbi:MAG: hypothetical protein ACLU8S_19440 [Coprococcus phoceensis]